MAAAAASTQSLPISPAPPPPPSPPHRRLTKVLTVGRRRSSDVQSDSSAPGAPSSVESLLLGRPIIGPSQRSPSRDGSPRSGAGSGVRNLIPGHAKRERKRIRDDEMANIAQEEADRGRQPAPDGVIRPTTLNRSQSSLVTVDSDVESPPALTSRDSHSGYLTTTSPLIRTSAVGSDTQAQRSATSSHNASTDQFPQILEPPSETSSVSASPKSFAVRNVPALPPVPGLTDKADMLRPNVDSSHARGKSPAKKFKDVFSKSGKNAKISPERANTEMSFNGAPPGKISTSFGDRRMTENPEQPVPSPLRTQTMAAAPPLSPKLFTPSLSESPTPKTPPSAIREPPTTTVTPPTPTDHAPRAPFAAHSSNELGRQTNGELNASGNETQNQSLESSIAHHRTRSGSGLPVQKSKLSNSITAPLTPTIEETGSTGPSVGPPGLRNVSLGGGGFFSSWVSAAQNAATSIGNLTNQNRSRAGTGSTDQIRTKLSDDVIKEETSEKEVQKGEVPRKELAIATLGSGDLNLVDLGIDTANAEQISSLRRDTITPNLKDDAAVKMEDLLAKRAVSQAYDKPGRGGEATPVAELSDPVASIRPTSAFDPSSGALTPPNGSIFEGETSSGVKRTNSVRSKLQNRRSRGSSVTTAQSALGAIVGASTAAVVNPATGGTKLSGFAIAPKPRNRAFHQQFRSVPEDDFLIEDYSCALQKEILLAGRLYISEGHICFSSNILGWVTTLIISFEEVVCIEKENTAIVIPNAIAVQTLHARHIFRSLLSREATYDLMIGIWRVNHPDSFQKSVNGKQQAADQANAGDTTTNGNSGDAQASDDESDEESSSEDDDASNPSIRSSGSTAGSELVEVKGLTRKPSGNGGGQGPSIAASAAVASGDATGSVAPIVAAVDASQDFPGPATHAPSDCTDAATHYDKIIKDEIIAAPLGKVYTLLFGPQSTTFMRKFLLDGVSKAQDLQLEDDKKGLDNDNKSRQYKYIKPLGGSIGPKQTTCITSETLDFFDLDKAVSVTCTTQTPDVPSGSVFSTKTRYCLSWAPGSATRFQMNMTIEWTAKSWLKGPIEKGALDGQVQYGDDLLKTLKGALGRSRAATAGSKILKGKKKRKSSKKEKNDVAQAEAKQEENWGAFEIFRPTLGPVVNPVKPFVHINMVVTVLVVMVLWIWIRGSPGHSTAGLSRLERIDHMMIYDDLWRREESDLWDWLQERAGVERSMLRGGLQDQSDWTKEDKLKLKQRQALLKSKDVQTRLREEKKSMKEMEEAVRITQERLDSLQKTLERQKNSG